VAHGLGLRRKLARHRGAVFMGPAALPRWSLALASRWSRAWGSPRFAPDNAAYAKLALVQRAPCTSRPSLCVRPRQPHAPIGPQGPRRAQLQALPPLRKTSKPPLPRPWRGVHRPALIGSPTPTVLSCCPWLPATGTPPAPQRPRAWRGRHAARTSASVPSAPHAAPTPRPSMPRSARTRGAPAALSLAARRCHAPRRRSPTDKARFPTGPRGCAGGRDRAPRRSRCL
jgi:hypothetical protein